MKFLTQACDDLAISTLLYGFKRGRSRWTLVRTWIITNVAKREVIAREIPKTAKTSSRMETRRMGEPSASSPRSSDYSCHVNPEEPLRRLQRSDFKSWSASQIYLA